MQKFVKYFMICVFCITSFIIVLVNPSNADATSYPFEGMIDADSLVVRSEASSSSTSLTELVFGTKVSVVSESGNFYKIKYDDNKDGYVLKSYVLNTKLYTSTSGDYRTYCDSLISNGFIESYCPQLYYLHTIHPNWIFKADNANITLDDASKSEEYKTVLQTGNSNYYLSNTPIESNYYYIKANVIASFMDPRNSLYEDLIFQYLDLESSKDIVNDVSMTKIVGSTGYLKNFFNEYKKASSTYGINPLHALARSVQEGVNKTTLNKTTGVYEPTYSAVTGKYTTSTGLTSSQGFSLDGYYNFYNIGSYKSAGYPYTVQRGLAYGAGFLEDDKCISYTTLEDGKTQLPYYDETKCGKLSYQRPWNTISSAISGGVEFLANSYVKKGQNTLYFQKFNVSSYGTYTKYTHQYMTNIWAPASEGSTIYNAYKAGNLLDSNFTFIIPIYKDLTDTIAEPVDKNGDATLKEIRIDTNLVTGFDKDVTEYPYSLQTNNDSFNVTAAATNSLTKVEGTGTYKFTDGSAVVTIKTTAEDGTNKTYIVTVKQVKIENEISVKNITDKLNVKIDNNVIYGISPGFTVQELINSIASVGGSATIVSSSGTKKTSGTLATGDIITINGTIESKVFNIAIRGDVNGDGKISVLDLLRCQKSILKSITLSGAYSYAADANYDGKVSVLDMLKIQKHILGSSYL